MRALVTGAAGFIGSTLVSRLTSDGHDVVGIDSFTPYYDRRIKESNLHRAASPMLTFVDGDLNDIALEPLLEGVDVVFHLAGQPGVRSSWGGGFAEYTAANIGATQRLLEASANVARPPRVVYASSSSVYGDAESYPTREDALPQPRSPYGVTKLAGEHLVGLYAARHGLPTTALRFFTVYGPGQRPDMAFTRFLRAAVAGRPISLYGSGEQIRDFTYVDDIVDALVRAGSASTAPGLVLNVSGGGSHSVNEVLAMIGDLTGAALVIEREAVAPGDVSRTAADISAITRALDWAPRTALRDGLAAQLAWVRDSAAE